MGELRAAHNIADCVNTLVRGLEAFVVPLVMSVDEIKRLLAVASSLKRLETITEETAR
jgi:hypothetical protein